MATDYLAQIGGGFSFAGSFFGRGSYDAINSYLGGLNDQQRQTAMTFLRQWANQHPTVQSTFWNPDPLSGVLNQVQVAVDPKLATPQGLLPDPTSTASSTGGATGGTGATGATPALGGQVTQTSPLTQQQYIDLMRLWGLSSTTEVDQMMRAFMQSYRVTYALNQNADFVGGLGGTTFGVGGATAKPPGTPFQAFQQEQQAFASGGTGQSPWTMALQPMPDDFMPGDRRGTIRRGEQNIMTAQDVYAAAMYSSGSGGIAMRILQQYREKYLNQMGRDMPPDLAAKLQAAISGLSASDQQQWLEASIGKPGAGISIGALDDIMSSYEQLHPTKQQQEQILYGDTYNRLKPLWEQYFGSVPTEQQVRWAVGKSQTELQDFIDNSPSHVKGLTIGRYNDYVSFINNLGTSGSTTHAFSAGVDDSLISDLHHELTSQPQQSQKPGAMQ